MKATGTKHDGEKPQLSIVPRAAMVAIAQALMFGARKYDRDNFKGGIEYTRLVDAALRHLTSWVEGEDLDPESGLSHLAHAGATLAMLIWMEQNNSAMDNRYKGGGQNART